MGRLHIGRSGSEARAAYGEAWNGQADGPYSMGLYYDVWGNLTLKEGWGAENAAYTASYTNNRRNGSTYDAAGNITNDGQQTFTYDATGQQTYASGTGLTQSYDGDRIRVKKVESGATTYYLRSSVLGQQVVTEINSAGQMQRGYVYLGSQMLAVQEQNQVSWVHQDPVTKSQRLTNSTGAVVSVIELDPWGGEIARSSNQQKQPHRYTSYERDSNGGDEAMMRRYESMWSRFAQPDPYNGSNNLTDPQSLNRYSYVHNDPVNYIDSTGLYRTCPAWERSCNGGGGGYHNIWDWGYGRPGSESAREEMRHNSIIHNGFDPEFPDRDDYSRAFAETLRRLEKPGCAAVFGGQEQALGTLAGSWIRVENLGTARFGSRGVESTAAYTHGNSIVINSHGGALTSGQVLVSSPGLIMSPRPFQLDTWGLHGADFGALIFLHELGHRVGIYGKNEDDATNITANQANTKKIFDACFK